MNARIIGVNTQRSELSQRITHVNARVICAEHSKIQKTTLTT
jgi:hypothetical protein